MGFLYFSTKVNYKRMKSFNIRVSEYSNVNSSIDKCKKKFLLVLNRKYRSLRDYIAAMRVPNAISSLLSEQLIREEARNFGGESEGRESECPLLPLPVDARDEDWRRSEQSPENTVCSCKQMAGNYLQFAIYTSVLPLLPHRLAVSRFRGCFRR